MGRRRIFKAVNPFGVRICPVESVNFNAAKSKKYFFVTFLILGVRVTRGAAKGKLRFIAPQPSC